MIIRIVIVIFATGLKWAKLPILPDRPSPGPMPAIDVAAAPADSMIEMPDI